MIATLLIEEALVSVASTHDMDCQCVTCRAADGDEGALREVIGAVARLSEADEEARNYGEYVS